jgi:polar amino acid transport system permease protein
MTAPPGNRRLLLDAAVGLLLVSFIGTFLWWIFASYGKQWRWDAAANYSSPLWKAWFITLAISAGALPGSCLVAALFIAGSRSRWHSVRLVTRGIVEVMRGMPLLALILLGFYLVWTHPVIAAKLDAFGISDRIIAGIVLLSVFTAAYLSEILRGGLDSIPQGQIDSARAVGFDRMQVFRYVIFPQALRRVLPALAGQFVDLVKSSSLLSIIGIGEFYYEIRAYNSATFSGLEAYVILAAGYLLINIPIALLASWMERRFRYQM